MRAFPCAVGKGSFGAPVEGMELRDYCAVRLIAAQFSEVKTDEQAQEIIRAAYCWAQFMCCIRNEQHDHPDGGHSDTTV